VVIPTASQILPEPLQHSIREKEHPLLSSFPYDFRLLSFEVDIASVKGQNL